MTNEKIVALCLMPLGLIVVVVLVGFPLSVVWGYDFMTILDSAVAKVAMTAAMVGVVAFLLLKLIKA